MKSTDTAGASTSTTLRKNGPTVAWAMNSAPTTKRRFTPINMISSNEATAARPWCNWKANPTRT